jgi:protein-disulfide isomerase
LQTAYPVQYKRTVRQRLAIAAILALTLGCLSGASCGKNQAASPERYDGVGSALDNTDNQAGAAAAKPTDLPGVDTSRLSAVQKNLFGKLADKLPSPCGKAHSLRKSVESDTSCKRAPFAARYVATLVGEDLGELEIRDQYDGRYRSEAAARFRLEGAPHKGPTDAKVVLVEFFDYGCPHCAALHPTLEQLADKYPSDLVLYLKFFPLSGNPHGEPAARAAYAAHLQGKFLEMHSLLFQKQGAHTSQDLVSYAAQIGLDPERFLKDYNDKSVTERVRADRAEGIRADLDGTPTLFLNGQKYTDPLGLEYLSEWVDEHLAVNR